MVQLGNTLRKIAREKAAIIKPGCIGLTGSRYVKRGRYINLQRAMVLKTNLDGTTFTYRPYRRLYLNLPGQYQVRNAVLAIEAARALGLPTAAIIDGLRHVKQRARFEVLSRRPLVIADGAHNPQKITAFVQSLQAIIPLSQFRQRQALLSVKYTKDLTATLAPLVPLLDQVVLTSFAESASLPQLKRVVQRLNPRVHIQVVPNLPMAYRIFRKQLDKSDLGIITGSLYMIGDLYSVL
jgi:dihydrofolate synthase/folylpolyglutamate synthase